MFILIFDIAIDIPVQTATQIQAKWGTGPCIQLVYQAMSSPEMIGPLTRAGTEIRYFLSAFEQCTENRNHLMQSSVFYMDPAEELTILKPNRLFAAAAKDAASRGRPD